mgnify:CR=1 FL=1
MRKALIFKIIGIENDIYYLKGMYVRLYADSYKDDLVLCEDYEEKDNFMPSIDEYRELNRNEYFYLPGKILHIDGDIEYLKRSMKLYEKYNVPAIGYKIDEKDMPSRIKELLQFANLQYEREKSFKDCRSEVGVLYRFDFYVNNKYLIEFDGE